MSSDRARVSYDPTRKWRGLVAQQGRVTVEADWNEAAAIDAASDRRTTLDVVGPAGTPDGGYEVTPVQVTGSPPQGTLGDFTIGAGTLYLGGLRLDLDEPVTYSAQPDWLDHSTDPLWENPAAAVPPPTPTSFELVYLLASEQEVSAVEDPALADVALGGPDTMQRQRILQHFVRQPSPSGTCYGAWNAFTSSLAGSGVGFDAGSMMIESTVSLQVSFSEISATPTPCQPVATGGYLGAENQMIRVMVTGADPSGVPIIVWGFDDASFLYRITATAYDPGSRTTTLTLATSPPDSFHFPVAGQAVEVLRDAVQLTPTDYIASPAGVVSTLAADYDDTQKTLTILGELVGDYLSATQTPQLYLRVWQTETSAAAVPATPSSPTQYSVELDGTGVVVTLSSSSGVFHAGDFWRFALRPLQPTLVYPARIVEGPQPPDGPRTWACPLAVLTWEGGNPIASSCIPPFAGLVELTATQGGCCTVNVGPSDVNDGATLPTLIQSYANAGPITVCLQPGTYTLSAPLSFGPELNGTTLQACTKGVLLQAPSQPGNEFALGLIAMQAVNAVTIRGIELVAPLVALPSASGSFAALPAANQALMQAFSSGLQVAIGISADNCTGLTIEDCTLDIPNLNQANVFGAGIFATGAMDGIEITGCTFQSTNPPTIVPFNELAVTQVAGNQVGAPPPYQLTFGYLQVPPSSAVPQLTAPQLLHDATIKQGVFQGVTVPALVMASVGTLRVDRNTVRNSYAGFWFVSLADAAQTLIFDQLNVGDPQLYQEFADVGIATLRDGIFVIATQIGQLLLTTPQGGAPVTPSGVVPPTRAQLLVARDALTAIHAQAQGTAGAATGLPPGTGAALAQPAVAAEVAVPLPVRLPTVAVPVSDTGTSVSLRLDLCDCQIDAVIADSYSGAGLLVVDLTNDWGSAVLHGNRIRSRFPMGETALVSGLGEAAVTGNIVANEVLPQVWPTSHSMVLNPSTAATPLGAVLDPSAAPFGAAVAVTGNVFIDQTSLPARPPMIPPVQPPFTEWQFLNTEIDYGLAPPPAVSGVSPEGGPASGGTPVTVTGSGFTGATAVTFGATAAASFTFKADTQLTATSPAGAGVVDVTVTTPTGTSGASPADQFTYLGVTGVNPASGLAAGGYTVQVTGSGFAGATAVHFGPNLGTGVMVTPDGTQLTVTVPPGSGTVDVTVTTPLGTSPAVPADRFTYKAAKEGKDKEKDRKDTKELKEKDRKDTKEVKEKEIEKIVQEKATDVLPIRPQIVNQTMRTGVVADSPAVGRAFIAPEERPVVGSGALRDGEEENL
jgi:hypothetical protein